nr:M28 family peptidase [Candidatus Baldrarchaeota archaeon]
MLKNEEKNLVLDISADEIFAHIENMCAYGPRYVGSEADSKAIEYFKKKLNEYGAEVIEEEFEAPAFEERKSFLKITSPIEMEIPCKAVFFTTPTPSEGVSGELIFVGSGSKEEFEKTNVEGKIVVVENSPESPKGALGLEISLAASKGAEAYVLAHFASPPYVLMTETGFFDRSKRFVEMEPKEIPAVIIGSLHWKKLYSLMEKDTVKGTLLVDAIREKRKTKNVRGIILGKKHPEKRILLVAHRDTVSCPGASDNTSGNAIILELARIFSKYRPDTTIEIVSFGAGEVLGCVGSWTYMEKHKDELKNVIGAINLDAVGFGGHLRIVTEGSWIDAGPIKTDTKINRLLEEAAKDLNYVVKHTVCMLGLSDATPFLVNDVPAAWLWKYDDPYWHTDLDIPENIDPNSLKITAEIVGLAAKRLSEK